MQVSHCLRQAEQHQYCTHRLADDGRQCNAHHVHVQSDDRNQIEYHIDHPAYQQEKQRPAGIARRTQGGGAVIVQHGKRRADKVDAHVHECQRTHVVRHAGQVEHPARGQDAHRPQRHAAYHGDQHCRMQCAGDFFSLSAQSQITGNHHIDAHRKADQQLGEQVDDRHRAAHGSKACAAREAADYHDIRCIEQQLQNIGRHQRKAEQQNLAQQRAVGHINGCITFHDVILLIFCLAKRRMVNPRPGRREF